MVNITFPDGSVRSYEQGVTGYQIAESISPALCSIWITICWMNNHSFRFVYYNNIVIFI